NSHPGQYPLEVWDLAAGATSEPLHLDGHGTGVQHLAFSADGRRLATLAWGGTENNGSELKLWDLTSGRDLFTLAPPGGAPTGLAFDPDGRRLRVLLSEKTSDTRIALLDASPLAPEVEAIDLVDRLAADVPLNSELAQKIKAEPGLDPAVRAAALAVVPLRQ